MLLEIQEQSAVTSKQLVLPRNLHQRVWENTLFHLIPIDNKSRTSVLHTEGNSLAYTAYTLQKEVEKGRELENFRNFDRVWGRVLSGCGVWDILIFIFFSGVEHGGERKGGDEGERWLGLAVAVAALMKMNKVEV